MKLSMTVHLRQLTRSDTARRQGLPNRPPLARIRDLRHTALALDRIRSLLGHALEITSAYRSDDLNRRVGGVPGSQHTRGQAVDFVCPRYGRPLAVCRALARSGIVYDQMIYEYGCSADGGWIHISFSRRPRRRELTLCSGRTGYKAGLVPCRCRQVSQGR